MEWKHNDFSLKKKIKAQLSIKKVMLTIFLQKETLPNPQPSFYLVVCLRESGNVHGV